MVYLSSFLLSQRKMKNPNIYPYNVFRNKDFPVLVMSPITVLYGDNGSGKSTVLNLIANKLNISGNEKYHYGQGYIDQFVDECSYVPGDDEEGAVCKIPAESCYLKSEDILFEIKKIQQEDALERGYVYEAMKRGSSRTAAEKIMKDNSRNSRKKIIQFAQEKYSNGETAMQILMNQLQPDALYLLDEPEVSLSPQNQVKLAEEINELARFLNGQFIIATHSPFLLGTLNARIYDFDLKTVDEVKWTELKNVRYFYDFFETHKKEFL